MQTASQGELHFDERSLLLVEAQKHSGRANLPSRTFKTSLLRAVHGPIPPSTNPSCRSASVVSCTYRYRSRASVEAFSQRLLRSQWRRRRCDTQSASPGLYRKPGARGTGGRSTASVATAVKLRFSPCCSLPSRYPASILASWEKGGVLIWP